MAEEKGAADLLQEITCSLCLDVFQDPKRLPCDHVYCRGCLEGLAKHSGTGAITCPECRHIAQVANSDVATTFPTAFQVNRLKELYAKQQQQQKQQGKTAMNDESKEASCKLHSQPIALYCETCDEAICRDCLIATDKHKSHEYGYITATAEKYRKSIADELASKEQLEASLSTALAKVTDTKAAVQAHREELEGEIDAKFQLLVDAILEEKNDLKRKVLFEVRAKSLALASQESTLQKCHAELTETISSAKKASQEFSDVQLIMEQKKISQGLNSAVNRFQDLSLEPANIPDIRFRTMTQEQLRKACRPLSITFTMADPLKSTVDGQGLAYTETNKPTTVQLHLADSKGKVSIDIPSIEVELKSIRHGTLSEGEVTGSKSHGQYAVTYTATHRGRHSLSIKVNGGHIVGSPFLIYANRLPHTLTSPVSRTGELNYPVGLSWKNGNLYVGEYRANRVLVFDHELELLQVIPIHKPYEVSVDDDHNVYISSFDKGSLHKFSKDGEYLVIRGLKSANGIRINHQNELYVCETYGSRIQVYDTDLQAKRQITLRDDPYDVHFDKTNLYVTCAESHYIQVLTADGKPLYRIGKKGSKPGQLNRPVGLQIAGDLLYVTEDKNNRVSVFHKSGQFITTFGEGCLFSPEGIAIDDDGYVYVTSREKYVYVF